MERSRRTGSIRSSSKGLHCASARDVLVDGGDWRSHSYAQRYKSMGGNDSLSWGSDTESTSLYRTRALDRSDHMLGKACCITGRFHQNNEPNSICTKKYRSSPLFSSLPSHSIPPVGFLRINEDRQLVLRTGSERLSVGLKNEEEAPLYEPAQSHRRRTHPSPSDITRRISQHARHTMAPSEEEISSCNEVAGHGNGE